MPRVNWLQLPYMLLPRCIILFLSGSWICLSPSQSLNGIRSVYGHSEQVIGAGSGGLVLQPRDRGGGPSSNSLCVDLAELLFFVFFWLCHVACGF